jgi:hypothetical protein
MSMLPRAFPLIGLWRAAWRFGEPRRRALVATVIALTVAQIFELLQPVAIASLLGTVQRGQVTFREVIYRVGKGHFPPNRSQNRT